MLLMSCGMYCSKVMNERRLNISTSLQLGVCYLSPLLQRDMNTGMTGVVGGEYR